MATLWVTGAGGFVGGWLRAAAEEAGHEVVALLGPGDPRPSGGSAVLDLVPWAVEPQEAASALPWDLLPAPDALIHLAAMSSPPECENRPQLAQAVNVDGPRAFFTELFRRHPDCGLLQVSSGQVYRPAAEPLSERGLEVLQLLAEGRPDRDIASQMVLSLHTVKSHNRNIYRKLRVRNRTEAVAKARRLGLLPPR